MLVRLTLLSALAGGLLVMSGCAPTPEPGPTRTARPPSIAPGSEPFMPIGSVRITSSPPSYATPVILGYTGTDGTPARVTDPVPANQVVEISRTMDAGIHGLTANGVRCGTFEIRADLETDVVFSLDAQSCRLASIQFHGPEVSHHPVAGPTGSIVGTASPGTTISLKSLDGATAPRQTMSDESGAFRFDGLPAGTYAVANSGLAGSQQVAVSPDESTTVNFPRQPE